MSFKDHFGGVADAYASHRPGYPPELFVWLAGQCPRRALAWDCGAGSGQASVPLAGLFDRVVATDASAAQLKQAPSHPRIEWREAPAEQSGLEPASVDLVIVAQALHWFELDRFHAEAKRVLGAGGVIAEWCYGVQTFGDEAIDGIIHSFYEGVVGPYWPPERRHIESGYRDLPFPFARIAAPAFDMTARWSLPALLGYFRSWSATAGFIRAHGVDPVIELDERLRGAWGIVEATRVVRWPLSLRVGRL